MSWKTSTCLTAAALALVLAGACGKNSSSPSSQQLTSFVAGVQTSDGTAAASRSSGATPAASGGPTITATASGSSSSATVINGGSSLAELRSSAPFTTVYVSVIDDPLDGFYKLTLPSPTTDAILVIQLGSSIPANTFQTVFSVQSASGAVGPSTAIANTVNTTAATGNVQVSASWNTLADVDLHVVEPSGTEIYYGNLGPTASGGKQDLDANAACSGNLGVDNENIRWTSNAPNGTYTVRLDLFEACNTTTTNYVVTINNGSAAPIVKTGSFLASDADFGSQGSGRLITTFTHSGSSITTDSIPAAPAPLSPDALTKRALAIAHGRLP